MSVRHLRGRRRSSEETKQQRNHLNPRSRLGGGLHGSQVAAASRFLLLLDDGGGHGEAGHRLVALHAPSFCLCLPTDTGGVVRRGSDDARTVVLAAVPAWSNSPLLIELNWSGELLNHVSAWGGNWLHRAKRGWGSTERPRPYPEGSAGHPAG